MRLKTIKTAGAIGGVILFSCIPGIHVWQRTVSLWSLASWLTSIALTYHLLSRHDRSPTDALPCVPPQHRIFLVGCCVIGVSILAVFSTIQSHYHQDEFITAFTSFTLPPIAKLDWFAAYPPVWVSQFPVLFHVLQKPFFLPIGPSVAAVRISVWPYVIGIIVYLYILAYRVFLFRRPLVPVILYIALAPHVYLTSMGLHFISSTFFYIAAITHFLLFLRYHEFSQARLAGVLTGLAYLTYTSSYVTFPVVILLTLIWMWQKRNIVLGGFLRAGILTILVLMPFLVYAATVNNVFMQRVGQVNVLWGTWSDVPKKVAGGTPVTSVLVKQTVDAVRSLFVPEVGGLGGYNFGRLALLDPLTGMLFAIGVGVVLLHIATSRSRMDASLLVILLLPFVSGFVLTTHPPPFHRLSLLYPWFALIVAIPLDALAAIIRNSNGVKVLTVVATLALVMTNLRHGWDMTISDRVHYPQNSRVIGEYITHRVPTGTEILIAAFPAFHLGQELTFRTEGKYSIVSDESKKVLNRYNGQLLILLRPEDEVIADITARFPSLGILRTIDGIPLGDLVMVTPFGEE